MKLSILDIGTNTVLHLAIEQRDGNYFVLADDHDIARLGEGVDRTHLLAAHAQQRALESIERHLEHSRTFGIEHVVACGTSAMRDAENRAGFIDAVKEKTGITIEVISGDEEARMTYIGAHFNLALITRQSIVIDIGGGSTEIASGDSKKIFDHTSINIGAVRLTERFLRDAPPSEKNINAAREEIRKLLSLHAIRKITNDTTVIGVAGTITTLAQLVHRITPFDAQRVHGTRITQSELQATIEFLATKTHTELLAIPEIDRGRVDILLAGLIIADEALTHLGADEITASVCGLRYGLAMNTLNPKSKI